MDHLSGISFSSPGSFLGHQERGEDIIPDGRARWPRVDPLGQMGQFWKTRSYLLQASTHHSSRSLSLTDLGLGKSILTIYLHLEASTSHLPTPYRHT